MTDKHLTLFTKRPSGRYDSLIGSFYCEALFVIVDEDDPMHRCPITERRKPRKTKGGA